MSEPNPIRVNMTLAESSQSVDMTLAENGAEFPMQHSEMVVSTSTDYDDLFHKPQINGVELVGDLDSSDLGLQSALEFDDSPTEDSANPVTSGGVYEALQGYATSTALQTGLSGKQDTISDLDTIRSGAALGATAVQSEADPTVPSWAKASSKPTYTASEVGALPDSTVIPSKTSQLENDSGFITSAPVSSVNGRTGAVTGLAEASDIPTVPTNVSAFNNDAKYLHGNTKGVFYGTSTTTASTAEKAVTCAEFASSDKVIGSLVYVMFGHTNTADVADLKLNVNSTGAKPIKMMQNGSLVNLPGKDYLQTAMVYPFYYDGDYWICIQNHFPVNVSELTNDAGYLTSPNLVYCTCDTLATTSAKVATIVSGSLTSLHTGDQVLVYFNGSNTASFPTLKVGNTAAKSIMRYEAVAPGSTVSASWHANSPVLFVYDGTYWRMVGWLNTTYSTMSENEAIAGTATTDRVITAKVLKKGVETHAPVSSVNGQTGAVTLTIPTVPTDVSSFNNDAGYLTLSTLPIYNGGVS